jgi:pimeloyl-ACP methyl ester carboxylesterase
MEKLIATNGPVELVVHVHGDGPTVVLLHGWPDTSSVWDEVVPSLVDGGFRVAVPDLRGCGESSKPEAVVDYAGRLLAVDVAAIIDVLDVERVALVGHDWGASLAWICASFMPERIDRLAVLQVGHPTAFFGAGIAQQIKSWYMLLFHHAGVAETFLRKNDYEAIRSWARHPRAQQVIDELERDGQMSAHLRWYQANVAPDAFVVDPPSIPLIQAPVMGIWSSGDGALGERQMVASREFCVNGFRYERLEGNGHWVQLEVPDEISSLILDFLGT